MNILYHRKDFIVCFSPPDPVRIDDENTLQAALEGESGIRVLTTAATSSSVEAGRAAIVQEDLDPSMLVRSETVKGNLTQLFSVPADEIRKIYALSDHIEYVSPYQAAIRAYVEHRFKETQIKLDDGVVVAMVDIQGSVAFITILKGDVIEVFRFVATENLITEFHRTVEYYLQTHIDQSLFLVINSHEAAGELLSASGTPIGGPDVIPDPSPALFALNALEVTPRFVLQEIEARKEMAKQRANPGAATPQALAYEAGALALTGAALATPAKAIVNARALTRAHALESDRTRRKRCIGADFLLLHRSKRSSIERLPRPNHTEYILTLGVGGGKDLIEFECVFLYLIEPCAHFACRWYANFMCSQHKIFFKRHLKTVALFPVEINIGFFFEGGPVQRYHPRRHCSGPFPS